MAHTLRSNYPRFAGLSDGEIKRRRRRYRSARAAARSGEKRGRRRQPITEALGAVESIQIIHVFQLVVTGSERGTGRGKEAVAVRKRCAVVGRDRAGQQLSVGTVGADEKLGVAHRCRSGPYHHCGQGRGRAVAECSHVNPFDCGPRREDRGEGGEGRRAPSNDNLLFAGRPRGRDEKERKSFCPAREAPAAKTLLTGQRSRIPSAIAIG